MLCVICQYVVLIASILQYHFKHYFTHLLIHVSHECNQYYNKTTFSLIVFCFCVSLLCYLTRFQFFAEPIEVSIKQEIHRLYYVTSCIKYHHLSLLESINVRFLSVAILTTVPSQQTPTVSTKGTVHTRVVAAMCAAFTAASTAASLSAVVVVAAAGVAVDEVVTASARFRAVGFVPDAVVVVSPAASPDEDGEKEAEKEGEHEEREDHPSNRAAWGYRMD